MEINLIELLEVQREVNQVVFERTGVRITMEQYILAFNVEMFEYINAIGSWKWWKLNHKLDRTKVLDELADCFAFYLSTMDLSDSRNRDGVEEYLNADELETIVKEAYKTSFDVSVPNLAVNLMLLLGVENETDYQTTTTQRMGILIAIAKAVFEDISWEEIKQAYLAKSGVNIKRQESNY